MTFSKEMWTSPFFIILYFITWAQLDDIFSCDVTCAESAYMIGKRVVAMIGIAAFFSMLGCIMVFADRRNMVPPWITSPDNPLSHLQPKE